ncbi:thiamine/thiamine pyrophosphate ABC transporter permease [Aquamicrobium zhengzhouense]|uniref:Thiamine transport system permease protein ThiP n=1 Tax=Aquamicrobium zhengzhouense TaxID=2781738 RepID=A0ABS0SG38_9HYPH|nr:thiamine/thiamine pyrophosphate ABC transporter permease [Aquamicrobium zhengzhouense]MBI1622272.1 thiamine/thiamine pyrophosphate ABC transporter, permease protein [Aquamicrobium zhengzhouense]
MGQLSDRRVLAGLAGLTAVGLLIGGAFAGLISQAVTEWSGAVSALDPYLFRITRFTLWQALLSTLLSVAPAILIARALARHPDFPGRSIILRLFALPLALPAIVAALGILALLGRAGIFADLLGWLNGGQWQGIYGLSGILVAHVFFNLPLATRLLLHALETVPGDQWRLAAQLGMGPATSFRLIEWPVLRAALPGVAGLIFMLCITSFTIVLTLGGGPRATTLEVAIYQALRFDFDPARAVTLTIIQIALTVMVVTLLIRLGTDMVGDPNLPVSRRRPSIASRRETIFNFALILSALLFVAAPFVAIIVSGLQADLSRLASDPALHRATLTSLLLAIISAGLSILLSLSLTVARSALELKRRGQGHPSILERLLDTGAGFVLVVPPVVVGAGWFILLLHSGNVFVMAPIMVITVNAVMAMPFAIRAIRPAWDGASKRHEKLCASLGITGFNRLRLIDWPSIRRPALTAFAFAMALSLGDLGVIALFGSDAVKTLPYLLFERMGSYRTADAAGIALFLGIVCLALMMLADRTRRNA